MKRALAAFAALGLWCSLLLFAPIAPAHAADPAGFAPALSVSEGRPGDTVAVRFPYDGTLGEVGVLLTTVAYNPERFELTRIQTSSLLSRGYAETVEENPREAYAGYVYRRRAEVLTDPGETFTFYFRVRENALPGETDFLARAYDLTSPGGDVLGPDVETDLPFTVLPPLSGDASLLVLSCEAGTLSPSFSPETTEYTMTVPYATEEITFFAQTAPGASCAVNRRTLGPGGSDTVFLITVTAENGAKQVYRITVHREAKATPVPKSADARLLALESPEGALSPAFSPDVLDYTMTVPYETTSVSFTAEAVPGAKYRVNRKNLGAGGSFTDFLITVTAEDDETRQVYTVTVYREEKPGTPPKSADARLLALESPDGTLSPAFSPDVLEYSMTVPYETTSVSFTAEAASGAKYRVNRKNLGAGGSFTDFLITVTAEDGETRQVYTVTVYREEKAGAAGEEKSADARLLALESPEGTLSPDFSPDVLDYAMTVPYDTQSVSFTAETVPGAKYRVNRKNLGAGGSFTDFLITVTAEDGETRQVYTVTVYREAKATPVPKSADARLLSLESPEGTLSPAFSPDVLDYTMTVPYETQSISFSAEAVPGTKYRVNRKNLDAGGSFTDFLITVTAEDGETRQVYTVTVYREEKPGAPPKSADARLLSLESPEGALSPDFSPDVLEYTMTVPYETQSVSFTAEAVPGAKYRVNRKNLGAGGSFTDFLITVTAEDGETRQVYTVTVYREEKAGAEGEEKSADARLLALESLEGTLSPAFSPDVLDYTMTVPYETTSVSFTAEAVPGAKYRVNRKNLGAGGSFTDFLITVTAEDGETRQVYTVTVYREEKAGAGAEAGDEEEPPQNSGLTEVPVATPEGTVSPEASDGETPPAEEVAAPVILVGGTPSPVPALVILGAFALIVFLSGPLARRLHGGKSAPAAAPSEKDGEKPEESPPEGPPPDK